MASNAGPWLIAGAVALAAAFALLSSSETPAPLGRGSTAPDFSLPELSSGETVSLASLSGQVVLVNFWATWCKPCEDEMPAMQELYAALEGQGFEMLAVSVDEPGAPVAEFRDRMALTFPLLLDPEKRVSELYQTFRFPETFLVGRDGIVIERYIGPKEWNAPAYVDRIRRLLQEGA